MVLIFTYNTLSFTVDSGNGIVQLVLPVFWLAFVGD